MREYKVIYRKGEIYKVIDKIYNEDTAYLVLALAIEAGHLDSRIEYFDWQSAVLSAIRAENGNIIKKKNE